MMLLNNGIRTTRGLVMLLTFCWLLLSCGSTKDLLKRRENSLNNLWENLDISLQYHTGLSIYDFDRGKWLFNDRDDNYFTPASCTKILTMYTVLHYMDDRIPSAYYKIKGDTIIVWGGGDPGNLYPDIHGHSTLIDFLQSVDKTIVFSNNSFKAERYGPGWAWDDYPYNFQCEKTAFPIYGNRLWIERKDDKIAVTPQYFKEILSVRKDTTESNGRNEWGNSYFYTYDPNVKQEETTIPISFFTNDIKLIWAEAVGKDICMKDVPLSGNTLQIKGTERDSLLKRMMQESDNFIAEQLLLACALKQTGQMNENAIIEKVLKELLEDSPDSMEWVDGSGLSRYNMMTPRSLVWVMRQIIKQQGLEYVKSVFPAGGQSGTIKNDFGGINGRPYLYAKSGTLRHTYNLTGVLITNSGKVLLFSWMNNQFHGNVTTLKSSMEHLFIYLRDNY